MRLLKQLCGYEVEYLPNLSFRLMALAFSIRDVLFPVGKRFDPMGIRKGFVVVDFQYGPGSNLEPASQLVGTAGKVYAVDVQPLAFLSIKRRARKKILQSDRCVIVKEVQNLIECKPKERGTENSLSIDTEYTT